MLYRTLLISLFALAACGEKTPPEPAAVEAPVAAVEPEPEPEPMPEPEPEPPKANADFNVTITYADGRTQSGHVKRVERASDFYGDTGWEDAGSKLLLGLETGSSLADLPWSDIGTITLTPGKVPADVDCTYSSETQPWTYTCELRTPTSATTKDGKKWTVTTRYKWRLTFDDGSTTEFWLVKHMVRMQDTKVVTIDDPIGENYDIYTQLQDQLRVEVKGLVKTIQVN